MTSGRRTVVVHLGHGRVDGGAGGGEMSLLGGRGRCEGRLVIVGKIDVDVDVERVDVYGGVLRSLREGDTVERPWRPL